MRKPFPAYRDYRSPFTQLGRSFLELTQAAGASFIVHECGYMRYENWNHRGIRSPYWRLHYNAEPGNAVAFGDGEYPLTPDAAVLTPADVLFDTVGRRDVPHLWIHFNPSDDFAIALRRPCSVAARPALRSALDNYTAAYDDAADGDGLRRLHHVCKGILHLVFAALPREYFHVYPPMVHRVIEHIARHLDGDLSNPRLADFAGMGLRSFEYWFKRHVGHSPAAYVAAERIRAACRALALSAKSIDRIAASLGFPNRYYFSRVFRKHMGCGPAAFRKGGTAGG